MKKPGLTAPEMERQGRELLQGKVHPRRTSRDTSRKATTTSRSTATRRSGSRPRKAMMPGCTSGRRRVRYYRFVTTSRNRSDLPRTLHVLQLPDGSTRVSSVMGPTIGRRDGRPRRIGTWSVRTSRQCESSGAETSCPNGYIQSARPTARSHGGEHRSGRRARTWPRRPSRGKPHNQEALRRSHTRANLRARRPGGRPWSDLKTLIGTGQDDGNPPRPGHGGGGTHGQTNLAREEA